MIAKFGKLAVQPPPQLPSLIRSKLENVGRGLLTALPLTTTLFNEPIAKLGISGLVEKRFFLVLVQVMHQAYHSKATSRPLLRV